ncbi:MAG: hypothetical protein IPN34_22460 [Planctomycetes bacterium]|nr:hypothetical protein [Planctomycetota bacterium]
MKPVILRHIALAATLLAALPACTFNRQRINDSELGDKIRAAELEKTLVKGVTTEADLVRLTSSPPTSILLLRNDQRVYIYNFGQAKTAGLTLILVNILKTNLAIDTALFFFGTDGKLRDYVLSTNSEELPWQWWAFSE